MTDIAKGRLVINPFGNGFVNLADDLDNVKVIYIPKKDLSFAINLDIVEVEYTQQPDGKYIGRVVNYTLVGREFIGRLHHTYKTDAFIYVSELKKNLVAVPLAECNAAGVFLDKKNWVRLRITSDTNMQLKGQFLEVLDDNVDTLVEKKFQLTRVVESAGIPFDASPPINIQHRDLLDHQVFTIDPPSCQDADDAFSIVHFAPNDIRIYVHIADVASSINPSHPDFETIIMRGNTYYSANTNWPMIPAKYANDICSILPNKMTKVITTEFKYDPSNKTVDYVAWYFSIIRSRCKYDYDTADAQLATNGDLLTIYNSSLILKLQVDDFLINRESPAHSMVKYWMIATNIVMCRELQLIWRVNPAPTDFDLLASYITTYDAEFATRWDKGDRKQLVEYSSSKNDSLLNYLVKMQLVKAKYTASNGEHYGLGVDNYTHWTSPIRRAADLLNHCAAHGYTQLDLAKYLPAINYAEMVQDNIEAFILSYRNGETARVGDILAARIIGLSQYGITVYVETLDSRYSVHISRLSKERLVYDDASKMLTSANCRFGLFDRITLRVAKVGIETMEFDVV